LNNVSLKELDFQTENNYAFNHELLNYGVQAVTHSYLMQKAKNVIQGNVTKDEFVQKYGLEFLSVGRGLLELSSKRYGFFVMPLNKIESDGVFIPQQSYWNSEGKKLNREINLFGLDYANLIYGDRWNNKDYALNLLHRKWQPSDLENSELVEQGIKFGEDMWKSCVEGFDKHKSKQSQKLTSLGQNLIDYYSKIISGEMK
jgi:hypothetical protein